MSSPVVKACGCCDKGCVCHQHAAPRFVRCGFHAEPLDRQGKDLDVWHQTKGRKVDQVEAAERESVSRMRLREWDNPRRKVGGP